MTDRITPTIVSSTVLHDLNESLAALNRSSDELSSGQAILEPSDNPIGTGRMLGLESSMEGLTAYEGNVQEATSRQNTAASALTSIEDVVQRVHQLVVQAGGGIESQADLENIADEVEGLTESVKQDANVRFGNEYILSGTMTETAPYAAGAEDAYHGNAGSVWRAIAPGSSLDVGASAESVLGEGPESGDGKLLDVLRTVAKNLREGTPAAMQALHESDLEGLATNEKALTAMQAHIGTVVAQLHAAQGSIEEQRTTMARALSDIKDTNIAQTSLEYSSQQAAYEAALRSGASIVQMSLLEFLK